ncbi:PE-PPE domain-containing protein [Mycobacterium sp. GA-1841]|uniref:PE-PPE domain-containing protein n=1 Tax=Mycobacterium sp. GA-1841 TaxID=1834154 RepID=UPI001C379E17|nr:PE-PPE domain-containing protein [Mycobacterium sp. GA-1841]
MGWKMSSLGMAIAAPLGAATIAWSGAGPIPLPIVPAPTELLAQSLYMRGTKIGGYTDDDTFFVNFVNGVITQTTGTPGDVAVDNGDDWMSGDQVEYNGGFWPVSHGGFNDLTYGASVQQGLDRLGQRVAAEDPDEHLVLVGYSQSAVILSQYKANTTNGNITYVMVSNPTRPNGGILSRFRGFTIPFLDIPLSGPAPTTSPGWEEGDPPTTYDVTQQYDGWADFPMYPLNVFATANAVLGIVYLHGNYETTVDPDTDLAPGAPNTDTDTYRDTTYYTVGTGLLPLLRPLEQIGIPRPLLLALDAPLRVVVEQGYDRTLSPGTDAAARLFRISNPITDLANFINAIPVGLDDGFEAAGMGRPFGTTSAGMYGVGGPAVQPPASELPTTQPDERQQQPESTPAKTPLKGLTPVTPRQDNTNGSVDVPEDVGEPADTATPSPAAITVARTKLRSTMGLTTSTVTAEETATAETKVAEAEALTTATEKADDEPKAAATEPADTEKSETSEQKGKITRSTANHAVRTERATDKPDRVRGYVGKHRKAATEKSVDRSVNKSAEKAPAKTTGKTRAHAEKSADQK